MLFILLFEEINDILSSTHPLQRLDHCNVSCSGSSVRSPHLQHLPYLRKRRRTRSLKTYSPPSIQAQCPAGFSPTPRNPLQSRGCRTDSGWSLEIIFYFALVWIKIEVSILTRSIPSAASTDVDGGCHRAFSCDVVKGFSCAMMLTLNRVKGIRNSKQ